MSTATNHTPIAIVGAGPGGLALALYLQRHSIPFKLYEREFSSTARAHQGGTLNINPESGAFAIKECGLEEEFWKVAREENEQMKLMDHTGRLIFDDAEAGPPHGDVTGDDGEGDGQQGQGPPAPRGPGGIEIPDDKFANLRPEIDRTDLRNLYVSAIDPSNILYDHQLKSVILPTDSSTPYILTFHNQPEATASVLIGADGAWSPIRSLLTPVKPIYSGYTFYDMFMQDVDAHPKLAEMVGNGICMIVGYTKGILPQRNSKSVVRTYAAFPASEDWLENNPLPKGDSVKAKQMILDIFNEEDWDQTALDFIRLADEDVDILYRRIYALPPDLTWSREGKEDILGGLALIGDAAHVMSPFAGEGVNLALIDAIELGRALVEVYARTEVQDRRTVLEAITASEKEMWERGRDRGEESARNMYGLFDASGPDKFLEAMMEHHGPPS